MKFIVSSKILKTAMDKLSGAYNPNHIIPVLGCMKVEFTGGGVNLTVTDLQSTIQYFLECATTGTGGFLIPFKEIKSISTISDTPVTVEYDNKSGVTIKMDNDKFMLGVNGELKEFPTIDMTGEAEPLQVGSKFFSAINMASRSTCTDFVSHATKSHISIDFGNEEITVSSTDANNLFTQSIEAKELTSPILQNFLLPYTCTKLFAGLTEASVSFNKKTFHVDAKDTKIVIGLGEGVFIDWRTIVSSIKHTDSLTISRLELMSTLEKSLVIDGNTVYAVELHFKKGGIEVKTGDDVFGRYFESFITCEHKVSFEVIKIHRKNLLRALKQFSDLSPTDVSFGLSGAVQPLSIKGVGVEDARIIMSPTK